MSSLDRRSLIRLGLAAGLSLGVSACFKPLYGPTASGENLSSVLASIEVEPMALMLQQEELAHELRSELIYLLNGSGIPQPKRYRLRMAYSQNAQSPIIDAETGRSLTATLTGTIDFTLHDAKDNIVMKGRANAMVTYERPAQRFASVRANRDANRRLAKTLAGHIKTQLAAKLSAR